MTGKCPCVILSNGVKMPQIGLGTYKAASGDETVEAVKAAVRAGYRGIDSAFLYHNEASVGKGIKECGVPREELFITSKVWNDDHGYDNTLAAFERSRKNLGLEYLDLYLIHWPGPKMDSYIDTWRALEKLYEEKKVRAIGVSNFEPYQLNDILALCKIPPMVNQVEMHPTFQQSDLRLYCKAKNIAVTAWRPLGKGEVLNDPTVKKIAEKHKHTPAQIILRWFLQLGVIAIPKSSHEERIKQNFDLFDFELDEEDMKMMKSLDRNERMGGNPQTFFPLSR